VTYSISGTITGDVVEGVTVTLSGDDSDSVVTGPSGAYSFSGLADGSYTVTPSLAGYGFTPAATNVTVSGADQTGQDFVSALLVYDISGAITGDEVEGVTVTLSGDDDDSVVTGVGGTFAFEDLPPGDYVLTPTLAGYTFAPESINVTIVAADQTDQDFVSSEITYTLSGTITGDVVEGVSIALTGDATDSTTTAADGTYSFTGVVGGSYTVTPSLEGYAFTPASLEVTVSGPSTDNDFVSYETIVLPFSFTWEADDPITAGKVPTAAGAGWYSLRYEGGSVVYDIRSAASDILNGYTQPYAKHLRQWTGGSDDAMISVYYGQQILGKNFNPGTTGIRIGALTGSTDSTNVGNLPELSLFDNVGGANHSVKTHGFRVSTRTNVNPDTVGAGYYYDGVNTSLVSQSLNVGYNMPYECWQFIGMEIPPNFSGDFKWIIKGLGTGAYTQEGAVALPSGHDWSGVKLDHIGMYNWSQYSGAEHMWALVWVGLPTDDWPV
jgi:hypothetical protein